MSLTHYDNAENFEYFTVHVITQLSTQPWLSENFHLIQSVNKIKSIKSLIYLPGLSDNLDTPEPILYSVL